MERYLDPKAAVTFTKVFGTHTIFFMSLLNVSLPLEDASGEISPL